MNLPVDGLGDLGSGTGPIDVALELPQQPAILTWKQAPASRRAAAGRAEESTIAAAQDAVASSVQQLEGAQVLFRVSKAYNAVVVHVDRAQARKLLSIPGVSAVRRMTPKSVDNSSSDALIGAPQAWATGSGLTGTGVRIGIIDTGIDYTHKDFGGSGTFANVNDRTNGTDSPDFPSAKVAGGYDFAGDAYNAGNGSPAVTVPSPDSDPADCASTSGNVGHGTHVAATAAGYGENGDGTTFTGPWNASTPLSTMRIGPGVAPQATLYALRVFGCAGSTNLVTQALDWAMDPNGDSNFSDHLDVVNMSLGSNFGGPDDPDSVATNNAVAAGVQVVVSAGNAGDVTYVTGSPGTATKAVTVASSVDAGQVMDGVEFTPTGGSTARYAGSNSVAFDWTGKPDVTAAVFTPSTNRDGCTPFSGADLAGAAGHVLQLDWNPLNAPTFPCGSVARGNNAVAAGALGVILSDTGGLLSTGITGVAGIPMILTNRADGDAIQAAVPLGTTGGSARFSASLVNSGILSYVPREDEVSSFSSRGPRLVDNALKPDISAPGDTIFSAASGTGDKGQTLSGTSMAAPHMAGVMALLRQLHPTWTPEELKALALDTADADLYAGENHGGARLSTVRQGSGRVDIPAAVSTDVIAYGTDTPGAVSLSFGSLQVLGTQTVDRTIAVVNHGTSSATYALGVDPRTSVPGVSYAFPDGPTVTVGAGGTATTRLRLTAVGSAMDGSTDSTLAPTQFGVARAALSESAGDVTLTPTSGTPLRVAYLAVVRPASDMRVINKVAFASTSPGTTSLSLAGTDVDAGVTQSVVTPLELAGTSPRDSSIPASADLRDVGITKVGGNLVFGTATYGPHSSPSGEQTEFDVYFDVNNDGLDDYYMFNYRLYSGTSPTDVFRSALINVATGSGTYQLNTNLLAASTPTAIFNSAVQTMGVPISALHLTGTTLGWRVLSFARGTGNFVDQVGPFTYDTAHPGLDFTGGTGRVLYDDQPGGTIPVSYDPAAYTAEGGQGVLLLHHFNQSASAAQVVPAGPAVTSVAVTPTVISLAKGTTQQLTATATLADGTTQDVTGVATWSSDNGHATVDSSGLTTGASVGDSVVSATYDGQTGNASVTVTDADLVSIDVTPVNASLPKGLTQQYTATGTYTDTTTQDLTSTVTWGTDDLGVATIDSTGLLTAEGEGGTNVTATSGTVVGTTGVSVTRATLSSIVVTPANPSVPKGTTQQMTATGVYSDSTTEDLTSSATWSSGTPAKATVDNDGLVTAVDTGTSTVAAGFGGKSGSTVVTVTSALLRSIAVTPADPSVALGTTLQLTATGTFSDGSTQDITSDVTWSSAGTHFSISNAGGSEGLLTTASTGSDTALATLGSVSGSTVVTVTSATLASIAVTPANPSISAGSTQQFTATGTYSDSTTQVLTTQVTWASSAPAKASISNASGSEGLASGLTSGTTSISATFGGKSGSTVLTVTAASLTSITVTPANPSLPKGTTRQLTATGHYSDGSTQNLTASASWVSSAPSKVTVTSTTSPRGVVRGVAIGSATVTATSGGKSGHTTVTVTAAVLKSIAITPANPSLPKGTSKQLAATGTYTDGTTKSLTTTATWSSSGPAVTTSNLAGHRGIVVGAQVGSATVRATLNGITGSTTVTVTPAVLRSIAVTPAGATLKLGHTLQLTATGTYSDGSHRTLTSSVVWTVTAGLSLSRSTPGLVTGREVGRATVNATLGSIHGSTTVNVTP